MSMESRIDKQNLPGIIFSQIIKPYNVLVDLLPKHKDFYCLCMSGKGKGRIKDEGDAESNNFNHQTYSFVPVTKRGFKSSSK